MSVLDETRAAVETYDYPAPSAYVTVAAAVTKRVNAERDAEGHAKDLLLGATSNVLVEAVEAVRIVGRDRGTLELVGVTYDGAARTDETVLTVDGLATGPAALTAGADKGLRFVSTDAGRTAAISGLSLSNDGLRQVIATESNQPLKLLSKGLCADNIVAVGDVFGGDMSLFAPHTERSNVGDVVEAGFNFHINDLLQLELVRYSKVLASSGFTNKFQRVARFGPPHAGALTAQSDINDFAAIHALDLLR